MDGENERVLLAALVLERVVEEALDLLVPRSFPTLDAGGVHAFVLEARVEPGEPRHPLDRSSAQDRLVPLHGSAGGGMLVDEGPTVVSQGPVVEVLRVLTGEVLLRPTGARARVTRRPVTNPVREQGQEAVEGGQHVRVAEPPRPVQVHRGRRCGLHVHEVEELDRRGEVARVRRVGLDDVEAPGVRCPLHALDQDPLSLEQRPRRARPEIVQLQDREGLVVEAEAQRPSVQRHRPSAVGGHPGPDDPVVVLGEARRVSVRNPHREEPDRGRLIGDFDELRGVTPLRGLLLAEAPPLGNRHHDRLLVLPGEAPDLPVQLREGPGLAAPGVDQPELGGREGLVVRVAPRRRLASAEKGDGGPPWRPPGAGAPVPAPGEHHLVAAPADPAQHEIRDALALLLVHHGLHPDSMAAVGRDLEIAGLLGEQDVVDGPGVPGDLRRHRRRRECGPEQGESCPQPERGHELREA